MKLPPTLWSGLTLPFIALSAAGCAPVPIPTPVDRLGTHFYDPALKSFHIQAYASSANLNPGRIYAYVLTAKRQGPREFVLSGFVEEDQGIQPFRGTLGMARSQSLVLTDIEAGVYRFIDAITAKEVGTIDTAAPSPPFPDAT